MRDWLDSDAVHGFRTSPIAVLSCLLLWLLIGGAVLAPWIAPQNPFDLGSVSLIDSSQPPMSPAADGDRTYFLGTDQQGRDRLSAILYGLRVSLLVGGLAVAFAVVVGVTIGLVSGYVGGFVDLVFMRIADVQLTFPAVLTALLVDGSIRAALPRSVHDSLQLHVVVFSIGISLWPSLARTVRGSTMVERGKDYVLAARVIGVPSWRVALTHVLPNVVGPVMVIATLGLGMAILAEATLSFLGVGLPASRPSLGTLIKYGGEYLYSGSWWMAAFPGLALMLLVLAINLLGDWLRDALTPGLR